MGTIATILRVIKIIWPFIIEAVAGKRLGFMEAYKTRPRALLTSVLLVIVAVIGLTATVRLYTMSKEIIELKTTIHQYQQDQPISKPKPVTPSIPASAIVPVTNRHDALRDALIDIDKGIVR